MTAIVRATQIEDEPFLQFVEVFVDGKRRTVARLDSGEHVEQKLRELAS